MNREPYRYKGSNPNVEVFDKAFQRTHKLVLYGILGWIVFVVATIAVGIYFAYRILVHYGIMG